MRILMSALQPGGGIRTFFRYIYSQPCFSDCRFTLVVPDRGLSDFLSEFIPGNRITVVPARQGNLAFARQLRELIATGDFQLVHSHGFSAGLLTELAGTGYGVPHLMTAHDVFLPAQFSGWKGRAKHLAMSLLFRRMTMIHTVTNDARDNLLEFFPAINRSRVHGILHGVDTEYFREGEPRALKAELGLDEQTPLLGFFGRFMGQKGFRLLVDALEEIHRARSVAPLPHVATFGWGGFIREDYEYLSEKGLADYFHQCEQTNDMAAAIKGVDVVVMPSRWEACGLLGMEVLAAGVPIVGSQCIGLREVLEGSPAQTVPVGDSRKLTKALVAELSDRDSRRSDFVRFQPIAVDKFHIKRPAESLRRLYTQMLAGECTK
ncbi:glycosyltransferase family 4 protein [Marinobacter sp. 71-i]|uniref:Glycosyltransferase family 4 protein n=1 Tax=Marinobacter iranensis TaxID=2962607 RepID=A0ABT5Y9X6_9GAMM|nr:glycosyltransferase family 4 protein [Marinobacter iranensis]MDF0750466.1 glycosyltransferase family 4 protein [Marinobacter iranensis]